MIIRQANIQDAPSIARVHVDSWQSTYKGMIANSFLESLSYTQREKMWRDALSSPASQSFIYLAETADHEIVGFAAAGPERDGDPAYQGEIYALYLVQNQQRKGLGSMLFKAIAKELQARDFGSLLVWVLEGNPSRKFYEARGGKYIREKPIEIGDQELIEVAYGWANLNMLR